MKRSVLVAAAAALALGGGVLSACQPNAVPGRPCGPEGDFGMGKGADGGNTYQCVNGRWKWSMTTRQAAEMLKAANDAKNAAAATPPPVAPAETTTTTTAPPPPPAIPDIVGCYTDGTGDAKVVQAPSYPKWGFLVQYHTTTDGSCGNPDGSADALVWATSDAEADARCAAFLHPASVSGGLWWEGNPAMAGIYVCVI